MQMMDDFVQVESIEILVQSLKKKILKLEKELRKKKENNEKEKNRRLQSDLATTKSALDRAGFALENAQPKRKLSLEQLKIMEVLGEGGWGTVRKVSVINFCFQLHSDSRFQNLRIGIS
jgi:hypothetical protein